MKLQSSFIAILVLVLTGAAAAPGGQDESSQQKTDQLQERLQQMKDRLKLTPEQSEQVRSVLSEELPKLKAVREKYSGGDQSRRTRRKMARELRDIQSSSDEKLRKILSKEQMDELKKMREERRQQLRDRAGQK